MPTIFSKLCENATYNPERIAISDKLKSLTYTEFLSKVKIVANFLISNGFSHADVILVEAIPDVNFAVVAMGIHLSGCIFVPVEKNISDSVLSRLTIQTKSRFFIGKRETNVIKCMSFANLEQCVSSCEAYSKNNTPLENDVAEMLYTTGTTGKSKCVILSHKAVFASACNNAFVDNLNISSVYLIASPLNHTNALRKMYSCFIAGSCAVLLDGFFDIDVYYKMIEKYNVNVLLLPPPAVKFLLSVSREKLNSMVEHIKTIHTGSAPMSESDKDALRNCLPKSRLIFGYGTTEAGNACAYNYAEYLGMVNCVGKPNPYSQIKIVNEKRYEIKSSADNPGYIAISGDTLANGYLNDPEGTTTMFDGNTFYTNDIGYIDEKGFLFVIGRANDIINCGGMKIAPSEVENIVMQYDKILDAACFGIKDSVAGEAVKLIIVPENNSNFDMTEFLSFLSANLEKYKIPKIVECVCKIPKTTNGKTNRKLLK